MFFLPLLKLVLKHKDKKFLISFPKFDELRDNCVFTKRSTPDQRMKLYALDLLPPVRATCAWIRFFKPSRIQEQRR